ncbi:MAG: hypothetical protein HOP02_05965 [Methylococcaceae bacterium]|nr:hypothetical protein [Methylococcaceae bacterium]
MNIYVKPPGALMRIKSIRSIAALALVLVLNTANAVTVSLATPKPIYRGIDGDVSNVVYFSPGERVQFDVIISGLGDGAAPSLGAYDLEMFDPTAAFGNTFDGITYGTGLGATLTDSVSFTNETKYGAPTQVMHISQTSLEPAATLIANQPTSFTLASLFFTLNSGSTIVVADSILSDENGNAIIHDTSVGFDYGLNIRPATVPLPATWLLFSTGLALLGGSRRRSVSCRKA